MPEVLMPRLPDAMAGGTLSQGVKHEGDQIRRADILAVIETDKAVMDMEAYDEGYPPASSPQWAQPPPSPPSGTGRAPPLPPLQHPFRIMPNGRWFPPRHPRPPRRRQLRSGPHRSPASTE